MVEIRYELSCVFQHDTCACLVYMPDSDELGGESHSVEYVSSLGST